MIDIEKYAIFSSNKNTLKELSKDKNGNGPDAYMTDSILQAVNFDRVKTLYTNSLGLSEETAKSVDALCVCPVKNKLTFIEFKNGKLQSATKRSIRTKVRDSLLVFCDITNVNISYTRDYLDLILVYNENKNAGQEQNKIRENEVRDSESRTLIGKKISAMAKEEFILFDLEKFKKLYFNEVFTFTEKEFHDYIS